MIRQNILIEFLNLISINPPPLRVGLNDKATQPIELLSQFSPTATR